MASQTNDEVVIRSRGSRPAASNQQAQTAENERGGQQNEQAPQQQQQQPQESVWKTILTRMFFFWLITQFFKGRQSTTNQPTVRPSKNLFPPKTSVVYCLCFVVTKFSVYTFVFSSH